MRVREGVLVLFAGVMLAASAARATADGERARCGGAAGTRCATGQWCEPAPGRCGAPAPGRCVTVPAMCTMNYQPVCGCDGNTYGNDCQRRSARVAKQRDGQC